MKPEINIAGTCLKTLLVPEHLKLINKYQSQNLHGMQKKFGTLTLSFLN